MTRTRLTLTSLLLALLTLALYSPVRRHAFIDYYDDGAYITKNADVTAGLSGDGVAWAFTAFHSSNWHPLTWVSHQLDVTLFGLDPGPHHLMNVGLHALNGVLLFLFLAAATGRFWSALLVGLFFAVHPLRVESVAWAAERKDVLSGTFFFLTLLAYGAYARRPSKLRYLHVGLALACGLMAKPMLVTVPFLLLLLDRWPLDRVREHGWKRLVVEKLPLFALVVASSIVTWYAQRAGGAIRSFEALPFDVRIANAFAAYAGYLWKTIWPVGLTFFYPHPGLVGDGLGLASPRVIASALLVLGMSALACARYRKAPQLFTGWFWYVGMLVPVIGVFQVGGQWIADRYAYLPLIGVYVAVIWGVDAACRAPRAKQAAYAVGLLAVVACAGVTLHQIRFWKDSRTLFERGLAVTENNYPALSNLGYLEFQEGNLERAQELFEETIRVAPNLVDAHSNLGAVFMQRGEYARAVACFERALVLNPGWVNARLNLAQIFEVQGDLARAREQYEAVVRLGPAATRENPRVYEPLARILATSSDPTLRDPEHALRLAIAATQLEPGSWKARRTLAAALAANGRFDEALAVLGEALSRAPSSPEQSLHLKRARSQAREALFE